MASVISVLCVWSGFLVLLKEYWKLADWNSGCVSASGNLEEEIGFGWRAVLSGNTACCGKEVRNGGKAE